MEGRPLAQGPRVGPRDPDEQSGKQREAQVPDAALVRPKPWEEGRNPASAFCIG